MATICTRAQDYIFEKISRIHIQYEGCINSFNCTDWFRSSALILLTLKQNDLLVRGYIDCEGLQDKLFGWLEFKFKGQEFVLDPTLPDIIQKEDYYSFFEPRVEYKKTRKEILEEFLSEKSAVRLSDNVWQFNAIGNLYPSNMSNDYLPHSLSSVRIEFVKNSKRANKIIAYHQQ